jgi:RNA polymerase sigma factor (sigma-70 family)
MVEDAPLIARVIANDDRHAFATLVRRHQGSVRAFLLRLTCGEGALADDVAQEVFLHAYRRIRTYRSEGGFASWLFAIAYRAFLSEKRKRRWSAEELCGVPESAWPGAQHGAAVSADVARAMRHLREPERACLSLCYQWGMSHHEAAALLGCPVGTVKTHVARGKEKLRAKLSAYDPQREALK